MIVLLSFQLATRLNSQNTNETEFINEIWHINFLWILVFPIGIVEVSTSRKCCFWIYFSSLHDYWPPSTWNSLVRTPWGEMERCEKRALQLLKMRKKKISLNIKTNWKTDFVWQLGLLVWSIILVITWWAHKRQTFTLITIKKWEFGNFFLQLTGYLNTRKSFPICKFVVMAWGKCELHTHFTFLQ